MKLYVTKKKLSEMCLREYIVTFHPITGERCLAMISSMGSRYIKILIFDPFVHGTELTLNADQYRSSAVYKVENHKQWISSIPLSRHVDSKIPKPTILSNSYQLKVLK